MDAIEYRNIQEKVRKLHEHIDPRGCLEFCYADDLMPNKTDHYLYIGEITDCTEKPHILYECDGMACKDCFHKECHETTDITHAKNFKYYNGKWVERRDYSPRNLYC